MSVLRIAVLVLATVLVAGACSSSSADADASSATTTLAAVHAAGQTYDQVVTVVEMCAMLDGLQKQGLVAPEAYNVMASGFLGDLEGGDLLDFSVLLVLAPNELCPESREFALGIFYWLL